MTERTNAPVRLAELVASLSLATDLGMGQPLEQALRTCFLAVAAGQALGTAPSLLATTYYLALLRFIGCTADAHEAAAQVGGDEITHRAGLAPVVMGEPPEILGYVLTHLAAGRAPLTRLRLLAAGLTSGRREAARSIAIHCEVAQMLVARMGLPSDVGQDVGCVFEHWDGKGVPGELAGSQIPLPARIVAAARDVDIVHRLGGWPLVAEVLRRRRARAYDPAVVDVFLFEGARWIGELETRSVWDAVLSSEPSPQPWVGPGQIDTVLSTFADFADLKSPFTLGHSSGVATLVEAAAGEAGLSAETARALRQAALVHDLGRVGIPNGIWDKPGPLSWAEWEQVRLHPYWTERILIQAPALASLAPLAGAHHERLDGSGYHRGATAPALSPAARLLAAADVYQAMTQPRPHRPAFAPDAAATELEAEVAAGRLDALAVRAVLAAAGHARPRTRQVWPADLSEREVAVLRLIAGGATYRQVAAQLAISPKTVEHHVAHIYDKIGVSSRAAAALFAMAHDLTSADTAAK